MKHVAIVGASGHIGSSLAAAIAGRAGMRVDLYSRRPEATRARALHWRERRLIAADLVHRPIEALEFKGCDVVVNALGLGSPARIAAAGRSVLALTLDWEERMRAALGRCPDALYVYLSSGAVYGPLVEGAATAASTASLAINSLEPADAYGRAKFMAETMHRGWSHGRVLDVRVFGYVSGEIGLDEAFFAAQMFKALVAGAVFHTGAHDMVRDYVGPEELLALIEAAAATAELNEAVDIYSMRPVGKFELMAALQLLGLRYEVSTAPSPPPARLKYFTTFDRAASLGYVPARTSTEVVVDAARQVLAFAREAAA